TVEVGAKVEIQEDGTPVERYTIVGAAEADPTNGFVSNESPLGRALMGHKAGDVVTVKAPNGEFTVTLLKVE
ncbi:MAG TPA: transcription elongation factor GreA, partial [Chloroflexi bacterium]|nr:transcription elongation factor GreA [Chloroflexota bacterium]